MRDGESIDANYFDNINLQLGTSVLHNSTKLAPHRSAGSGNGTHTLLADEPRTVCLFSAGSPPMCLFPAGSPLSALAGRCRVMGLARPPCSISPRQSTIRVMSVAARSCPLAAFVNWSAQARWGAISDMIYDISRAAVATAAADAADAAEAAGAIEPRPATDAA